MTSWAGLLLAATSLWAMLSLVLGQPTPGNARTRMAFVLAWGMGVLGAGWLAHRGPTRLRSR
ncbi:hypothetical protein TBR22_A20890 [Luteitalea sp. TBR-22]|uniref:hypothetical protein n=1 Tax=Luteitalea sp. TBR-22 TaxID=2802971 RepID=UPI001AF99FF2|nr:hypothetical protein [Luteitalea sp. TBR-22]BCS32865.1 hypothetical protein TBR22_A20890 [Luteitalea sp. TBR-22]